MLFMKLLDNLPEELKKLKNYEILSFGGQISEDEYDDFWKNLQNQAEQTQRE